MSAALNEAQKSAAFALLRQKFLGNVPSRVRNMRAALEGQGGEPLERQFHSLAGIGGTYGYHEITLLARAGEAACLVDDDRRTPEARTELLHAIVNAIEIAAAQ